MAAASLQRMVSRHTRLTCGHGTRLLARSEAMVRSTRADHFHGSLTVVAVRHRGAEWSRSMLAAALTGSCSNTRVCVWRATWGVAPVPAIMTGTWVASCAISGAWSRNPCGLMLKRTTTAGVRVREVSATAPIGLSVPR
jgi:hypothetical protein